MKWRGLWIGHLGSGIVFIGDDGDRVEGTLLHAVGGSLLMRRSVPFIGFRRGGCVSISAASVDPEGDAAVMSCTGILRAQQLQLVWTYVRDTGLVARREGTPAARRELGLLRAMATFSETFSRLRGES